MEDHFLQHRVRHFGEESVPKPGPGSTSEVERSLSDSQARGPRIMDQFAASPDLEGAKLRAIHCLFLLTTTPTKVAACVYLERESISWVVIA